MADLIQIVDAALASASSRAGAHLVCRPGCTPCCTGVFPISHQDAARLRTGLELLSGTDPGRAQRLRARVAASLARLAPNFPGDLTTGVLRQDDAAVDAFDAFADDVPCPVLDPRTGTCDLYAHRPILCRTFGPPARTAERHLAHCELCFTNASVDEIAAAELDPTLPELELAATQAYDAAHHLTGETLVAFALRESASRSTL
ncbi:MAG: YkgJ family cysteine cluster protein [Acidobacteriota bacterium]|nr:YkgJ family cysteine cluster protein [Acidobacteriota bacterium]